jgi:hypothetical protein
MAANSALVRPFEWSDDPAAVREARLRLLLASGGDDRIWLDPATRRNRYGVPAGPAPDELWFSSSTASPVSERGWAAAGSALERLRNGDLAIDAWFGSLRQRLLSHYGAPGAEAVLAPSGTESELVALCLALSLADGPLVNIVVAPAETGSGVPAAAAGQHFLGRASLGAVVAKGARLAGWEAATVSLATIDIREPGGVLRQQSEVDQEAADRVDREVDGGAFALLHVLDASKTGRPGVSRAAAAWILARHPGRVMVVVDACQLRCPPDAIRRDLGDGFAVMLTGSKFAGGPAFCGALMLPAAMVSALTAARPNARPLAPYSAALDWPAHLRVIVGAGLAHAANLGLGLRWSAALAEIEAFEAVPAATRDGLLAAFDAAVRTRVAADSSLVLADPEDAPGAPGLAPVFDVHDADQKRAYAAMARGVGDHRPCHLGQPVMIGQRAALRVCASMPMIANAARSGFGEIETALDAVFAAWSAARA